MHKKILIPAVIVLILAIIAGIAFLQFNRKYELPILMYHNICEDEADVNSETVTAEKFRSDMQWLKDNGYKTVLPRDLFTELIVYHDSGSEHPHPVVQRGQLRKTVVISFDDGYRSNYELAYPILKELGMKAEISVITCMIDQAEDMSPDFCTWTQLREMSDSGLIEIGSHSDNLHNRDIKGAMYQDEANGIVRATLDGLREDLQVSCDKISKRIGVTPYTFAYPYGASDSERDKIVEEFFHVSFGVVPKKANLRKSLHKLDRFRINQNTDLAELLK